MSHSLPQGQCYYLDYVTILDSLNYTTHSIVFFKSLSFTLFRKDSAYNGKGDYFLQFELKLSILYYALKSIYFLISLSYPSLFLSVLSQSLSQSI